MRKGQIRNKEEIDRSHYVKREKQLSLLFSLSSLFSLSVFFSSSPPLSSLLSNPSISLSLLLSFLLPLYLTLSLSLLSVSVSACLSLFSFVLFFPYKESCLVCFPKMYLNTGFCSNIQSTNLTHNFLSTKWHWLKFSNDL